MRKDEEYEAGEIETPWLNTPRTALAKATPVQRPVPEQDIDLEQEM